MPHIPCLYSLTDFKFLYHNPNRTEYICLKNCMSRMKQAETEVVPSSSLVEVEDEVRDEAGIRVKVDVGV